MDAVQQAFQTGRGEYQAGFGEEVLEGELMDKIRKRYRFFNNILVITVIVLVICYIFFMNSDLSSGKSGYILFSFILFFIVIGYKIKTLRTKINEKI